MISADRLPATAPVSLNGYDSGAVYRGMVIPLDSLIILEQQRKTFEEIDVLAESIARRLLLNPPTVASFDEQGLEGYLDIEARIYEREYDIDELRKNTLEIKGQERFFVLIAGERRARALRYLDTEGCQRCKAEEYQGSCYERHFGSRNLEIRVADMVRARDVLEIQSNENSHNRVPPHEEADFFYNYFRILKEDGVSVTTTEFAAMVGRSPGLIRNALRYYELPVTVKDAVVDGKVPFGIACEIARLKITLQEEDEISIYRADKWLATKESVEEYRKLVSGWIEQRLSGQQDMFQELFTEEQERLARQLSIRIAVNQRMIYGMCYWEEYFANAARLYREGKLGVDGAAYSEDSLRRHLLRTIELQREVLGYIAPRLKPGEYEHATEELREQEHAARVSLIENDYLPPESPAISENGYSDNGSEPYEPEFDPSLQPSLLA